MIELEEHEDGLILPVRAQPGARVNELRRPQDGVLKVAVTQAPEKGKANKAIAQLLCKTLQLKKSQITMLTGATSSNKKFLIRDISAAALRKRIEENTSM